jgi:hypothetical protein
MSFERLIDLMVDADQTRLGSPVDGEAMPTE